MAKLTILNPGGGGGGSNGAGHPAPASAPDPGSALVPLRPAPMFAPRLPALPPPPPVQSIGGGGFGGGPIPVIIVAPIPLDVRIVGGMPAPQQEPRDPKLPKEKPQEGWGKWMLDLAGTGVNRAGKAAAGVAGGSVMPALATAAEGAIAGLGKLGPYGMAAAAGVKVLSETIGAVKETINGLVQRGRELAPYSGALASSAAQADVRKIKSDVGEAERIGPQLARLVDAQSRAEAMQQRMLEPIRAFMAEKLAAFLEKSMAAFVGILEAISTLPGIGGDLKKLVAELKAAMADPGDTTALVEKWARGFGGGMPAVAPAARAGARPAPLGIPLF